jgi:LAO/AO transport system kinase
MVSIPAIIDNIEQGDARALARAITLVENELQGSDQLLEQLKTKPVPLIGITGPPGAGKSSLVNALINILLKDHLRIGVIAVDPSSPFNFGSLLGDRIRLSNHFNDPGIFIRSMATRGSLGGLSEKIVDVTNVMRSFPFDYIFIETVGVGQSEVEIAGLADTTVVVLVPQAGDEVQTMKAGLMEIANIFVVNKSDHPEADQFAKNLKMLVASKANESWTIPVLKTTATADEGIQPLLDQIRNHHQLGLENERKSILLTEKIWRIIQKRKMRNVNREQILQEVKASLKEGSVNIYGIASRFSPAT